MKNGVSLFPHEQNLSCPRRGGERLTQEIEERLPRVGDDEDRPARLAPRRFGCTSFRPHGDGESKAGDSVRLADEIDPGLSGMGGLAGEGEGVRSGPGSVARRYGDPHGVADRNRAFAVDVSEIREDCVDVKDGSLACALVRGGRDEGPDRGKRRDERRIRQTVRDPPVEEVTPRVRDEREIAAPAVDGILPLARDEKREEPEDAARCDDEKNRQAQRLRTRDEPPGESAGRGHVPAGPRVYARLGRVRGRDQPLFCLLFGLLSA